MVMAALARCACGSSVSGNAMLLSRLAIVEHIHYDILSIEANPARAQPVLALQMVQLLCPQSCCLAAHASDSSSDKRFIFPGVTRVRYLYWPDPLHPRPRS